MQSVATQKHTRLSATDVQVIGMAAQAVGKAARASERTTAPQVVGKVALAAESTTAAQAVGKAARAAELTTAAQAVGKDAWAAERTTAGTVHIDVCNDARIVSQFHQLVLLTPKGKQVKTVALKQKVTRIGRSARNDLRIDDPAVSAHHMTLKLTAGSCVVSDLSSTNGTFVNGERLVGGQLLADGDELLLGKTLLRFKARRTPAGHRRSAEAHRPAPQPPEDHRRSAEAHRPAPQPPGRKTGRSIISAAAVILVCIGLLSAGTDLDERLLDWATAKYQSVQAAATASSGTRPSSPVVNTAVAASPVATENEFPGAGLIQAALDSYAAGWIARADQTLQQVQADYPDTVAAVRAGQITMRIATIQELLGKAHSAQQQGYATQALDCWDQVLQLDGELLGDRPSFFAEQVSLTLQSLLYDQALTAFKNKDNRKAGELCETILKINPLHQDARALSKCLG